MEATVGWRADVSSLPGPGVRILISEGDGPATVQSVLNALQTEPRVGSWLGACLGGAPMARDLLGVSGAYARVAQRSVRVRRVGGRVASSASRRNPTRSAPASNATPPGALVAVFPNLSGDAILVAPTEGVYRKRYPPSRRLLARCAASANCGVLCCPGLSGLRASREGPAWVSTAGDGVAWLHGRVEQAAKILPLCAISRGAVLKFAGETTCSSARSGRIRRRRAWRGARRTYCAWMS